MGAAIGQILGYAVGAAISPVPIIAVILILFSKRAASNSLAFLAGWLVGLVVVMGVVLALGLEGSDGDRGGWIRIVVGVAFLGFAVQQWRSRPADGDEPKMPAWMASVDEFTTAQAAGMGVLLSAVNPKNLGLTLAAAVSIGGAGLDTGDEVIVGAVYIAVASATLIVAVVGYLLAGEAMTPVLDSMKSWLSRNNAALMAVLFVILGASVLGDGITIVTL